MACVEGRSKTQICIFILVFTSCFLGGNAGNGVNGGKACIACTAIVALLEQSSVVHNETVTQVLGKICHYLPGEYETGCRILVDVFGPIVIDLITQRESPDVICHALTFCYQEPKQPHCHLFPLPQDGLQKRIDVSRKVYGKHKHRLGSFRLPGICKLPGISLVCKLIERAVDVHKPSVDFDDDDYSITKTLRGSNWRGKDCNDLDKGIRPGRKPLVSDLFEDSNCNGIFGQDPQTGQSYEEKFCQGSGQRGVVVLGDSVGAHFHIPPQWLRAKELSWDVLKYLPEVLENEFDWPQLSTGTGYMNNTWPIVDGPTDSIYMRLRERNRCIHRDYQNLAVNGARSSKMAEHLDKSLSRNQTTDYPLLILLELVGNDVCNGDPDTLAAMTTPAEMRANTLKTLSYLDSVAPNGTGMVIMGLTDGRVLYDNLKGRYHPIGELRKDVTYDNFYDYLSCLQISPCTGWLSTNETLRNLTSERAAELNAALNETVQKYGRSFQNLKVDYISCPLGKLIDQWKKEGGQGWQLLEPVDGFHPNQKLNAIAGKYLWEYAEKHLPHHLGPVNPHNADIIRIFGNQGGH